MIAAFIVVLLQISADDAPRAMALDEMVTGQSASETISCFAVSPPAGERVEIVLSAAEAELTLARGALCTNNAIVRTARSVAGEPGRINFVPAGGRYLVIVRGGKTAGRFSLIARRQGSNATAGSSQPPSSTGETPRDTASARQALMLAQTSALQAENARQRNAEIAAAEQRRLSAELAAARRSAQEAELRATQARNSQLIGQAWTNNMRSLGNTIAQNQAEQRRYDEQIAQLQTVQRNAERASQEADKASAMRAAETRRQAGAAPAPREAPRGSAASGATATAPARAPAVIGRTEQVANGGYTESAPEIIAMLEGVVVCPINPDRSKLYGESLCHGPFQSTLSDPNSSRDANLACGTEAGARELGLYSNYKVWGCQYGINPRRKGSPNIDQAARFGLIVPARITYRCDAKIDGFCRGK